MATINNAVQEMVDHLVDKMQSSNKLTAEEQTLVSNAIQKLSNSANLETALVAVAEQHLDTATGEIKDASALVKDLQAKLLEQSDNLGLLPGLETKFNNISDALTNKVSNAVNDIPNQLLNPKYSFGVPSFRLDYYDNTVALLNSANQAYGAHNMISLVNYDSGCFHMYYDGGQQTNTNNKAVVMTIDQKGNVDKATRNSPLLATNSVDNLGLIVLPDNVSTIYTFTTNSKLITIYKETTFTPHATQDCDYYKLYQDPISKYLYIVNAGILHVYEGQRWTQNLQKTFENEAAFDNWASNEQGYVALHTLAISPTNASHTQMSDATGSGQGRVNLLVTRPSLRRELSYRNNAYSDLPSVNTQNLARHRVSKMHSDTSERLFTRSFKSKINLPSIDGMLRADLESLTSNDNYANGFGTYDIQYSPQFVTWSPIHRALVVYQRFSFYYSGGSATVTSQCRVYFA